MNLSPNTWPGSQEIHLVPVLLRGAEASDAVTAPQADARALANSLVVPAGVTALVASAGEPPRLASATSADIANGILLEPALSQEKRLQLLLVNPAGRIVRVNNDVAPRVVVLKVGDRIRLDDEAAFYVCLYRRPPLGLARDLGVVGKTCPVSLLTLQEDDVCYACECGTAYHCNPPESGKLECARTLSRCLTCEREIVGQEGFARLPDFAHE